MIGTRYLLKQCLKFFEFGKFFYIIDCYASNKIYFAGMYLMYCGKTNVKHMYDENSKRQAI